MKPYDIFFSLNEVSLKLKRSDWFLDCNEFTLKTVKIFEHVFKSAQIAYKELPAATALSLCCLNFLNARNSANNFWSADDDSAAEVTPVAPTAPPPSLPYTPAPSEVLGLFLSALPSRISLRVLAASNRGFFLIPSPIFVSF